MKRKGRSRYAREYRRWTKAEEDYLRLEWGEISLKRMSWKLRRTVQAIVEHAKVLGLSLGTPQGLVSITRAGKLCGLDHHTAFSVLKAAKVKIKLYRTRSLWQRTKSRPNKVTGKVHARPIVRVVDEYDALEALSAWLERETQAQAARRIGIAGNTLKRARGFRGNQGAAVRLTAEEWNEIARRSERGRFLLDGVLPARSTKHRAVHNLASALVAELEVLRNNEVPLGRRLVALLDGAETILKETRP